MLWILCVNINNCIQRCIEGRISSYSPIVFFFCINHMGHVFQRQIFIDLHKRIITMKLMTSYLLAPVYPLLCDDSRKILWESVVVDSFHTWSIYNKQQSYWLIRLEAFSIGYYCFSNEFCVHIIHFIHKKFIQLFEHVEVTFWMENKTWMTLWRILKS